MTPAEHKQSIAFQDAIGKLVDQYLLDHMNPVLIKAVLLDEAAHVFGRLSELKEDGKL